MEVPAVREGSSGGEGRPCSWRSGIRERREFRENEGCGAGFFILREGVRELREGQ
jgi:hypothetical protein